MNHSERGLQLAVACAFADALDNRAYDVAAELLAPDCVYEHPDGLLVGPQRIVRSYAMIESTIGEFEKIEFSSAVRPEGDAAVVTFCDRLTRHDLSHEYRCQQRFVFNEEGYIRAIQHQELPGHRERLARFLNEARVCKTG